jgi:ubiquinone/menaquinone biosynthesis C-methylase UbiE
VTPSVAPSSLVSSPAETLDAETDGIQSLSQTPAFAKDQATSIYYDRRAGEYDEWYTSEGRFALQDRPGWDEEVTQIVQLAGELTPARTLDVACGTGFLTQHLRGFVVGLDQSPSMVSIAQSRLPAGLGLIGDALRLVVSDHSFDRIFTGHFYGHLPSGERTTFLAEASRVAPELIVVDAARRPGVEPEQWQERVLNDGSRHRIYKRYFSGDQLARELGGEVLLDGAWFVAARVSW